MKGTKKQNIKIKNKSAIILALLILVILVAGTIIICTKGFAFDLNYANSKKVELNIGKQFERKDIKEITDQIFENQNVQIQEIEVYKDNVSITVPEITDEQKNELVSKVNEKYGTELKAEDIKIEENAHIRGRKILKPYIIPFAVVTIIIVIYFMIRYYKINTFKIVCESVVIIALAQAVLFAIMAITRVPIGTITLTAIILVYVISTYICTAKFNQNLDEIKTKENK